MNDQWDGQQYASDDMEAKIEEEARRRMRKAQGEPDSGADTETPEPVNIFARKSAAGKLSDLVTGMQAIRDKRLIDLPDVSRSLTTHYGREARIQVEVGTVPLRAVLSSGILPPEGRTLVQNMLARSEEITKMQREKVGMEDIFDRIVEEDYAGDAVDATAGALQLSMGIACLGVKNFYDNGIAENPPLRLVFNENDHGFWVGLLTDEETNTVASAVWSVMEEDAKAATPFPHAANPPRSLRASQRRAPSAARGSRPDEV